MLVRKISAERARLEERLRQPVDPSAAPANVKKMPHARRAQPRDDTVKSVVILLFVFGCVAVVFAAHWARRAVNATKEAPANFTETVRRLYAQETTPDAYHPSSSQRDYVRTNLDEFVSLHREEMERLVDDALARFRAKKVAAGEPMSDGELAEAERSARILMASRFAKSLVRASWRRVAKIRTRRPQLYKPEASCDSRERWWMAVGEISEKRQPVRVFS